MLTSTDRRKAIEMAREMKDGTHRASSFKSIAQMVLAKFGISAPGDVRRFEQQIINPRAVR